jgi:hypothetical protein
MGTHEHDQCAYTAAGLNAVIDLFLHAAQAFNRSLGRSDDVADEIGFTGSIHELGFTAGRVQALAEALTLLTGSSEWTNQARNLLAEYLEPTVLPEEAN